MIIVPKPRGLHTPPISSILRPQTEKWDLASFHMTPLLSDYHDVLDLEL